MQLSFNKKSPARELYLATFNDAIPVHKCRMKKSECFTIEGFCLLYIKGKDKTGNSNKAFSRDTICGEAIHSMKASLSYYNNYTEPIGEYS